MLWYVFLLLQFDCREAGLAHVLTADAVPSSSAQVRFHFCAALSFLFHTHKLMFLFLVISMLLTTFYSMP